MSQEDRTELVKRVLATLAKKRDREYRSMVWTRYPFLSYKAESKVRVRVILIKMTRMF